MRKKTVHYSIKFKYLISCLYLKPNELNQGTSHLPQNKVNSKQNHNLPVTSSGIPNHGTWYRTWYPEAGTSMILFQLSSQRRTVLPVTMKARFTSHFGGYIDMAQKIKYKMFVKDNASAGYVFRVVMERQAMTATSG